jgi:peptidoglycan/LPS O-acetylase OafA/YrhL
MKVIVNAPAEYFVRECQDLARATWAYLARLYDLGRRIGPYGLMRRNLGGYRAIEHALQRSRIWQLARRELLVRADERFPALDGVRALAALLIVAFHSNVVVTDGAGESGLAAPAGAVRWIFAGSWIGVDIFFALSGFLIGRILFLQLLEEGRVGFKRFYIRRVFRIFPAYYVVLTLSLFVLAHFGVFRFMYGGATWLELLKRSPANYLYIANYLFGATVPNALLICWSLCIEEHFYLLVPGLLALLFSVVRGRQRLAWLVALLAVPVGARCLAYVRDPSMCVFSGPYWQSHVRADGLLLGLITAYCYVFEKQALGRVVSRMGSVTWIGGFACIISVFLWGGPFAHGIFAVVLQFFVLALGSTLLIVNGLLLDNVAARVVSHPAWYPVARVSYGIYLVHLFAVLLLLAVWPGGAPTLAHSGIQIGIFAFCAAGMATAVAAALFLSVERPMLEWGVRISRSMQYGGAVRTGRRP